MIWASTVQQHAKEAWRAQRSREHLVGFQDLLVGGRTVYLDFECSASTLEAQHVRVIGVDVMIVW